MPATIIETNSTPLQSIEVESVTVDIIENALKNAREEMDAVLFRTAMSPGIREQGRLFPNDRQQRWQNGGRSVWLVHWPISVGI